MSEKAEDFLVNNETDIPNFTMSQVGQAQLEQLKEGKTVRGIIQSRTSDVDMAEQPEIKLDLPTKFDLNENKPLTWQFDDKDYPVFIADRSGNIGVPIIHPVTKNKVAILGANFSWEQHAPSYSQPFLEHLNLKFEDISNANEEVSETKRRNLTKQNVNLFQSLIIDGWLTKINEFGESGQAVPKSREQMLSYPEDIQSSLIDEWLGRFYIERHFPQGQDEVDILLGQVDSVFFKCKIGNIQNPAHVLLLEFKLPSNDAQRDYDDNTRREKRPFDRPQVRQIDINHQKKLQYAKKHLIGVHGAAVIGELLSDGVNKFSDTERLTSIYNDQTLKLFKDGFNPQWFVRLADALHGTFNIMGK